MMFTSVSFIRPGAEHQPAARLLPQISQLAVHVDGERAALRAAAGFVRAACGARANRGLRFLCTTAARRI